MNNQDLFQEVLPEASWLWHDEPTLDPVNRYVQFRKTFELKLLPTQCLMCITADESYQLFINGQYVGRGPARGYQSHWPVDEYVLDVYLREGINVIGVLVHNPGVGTFRYRSEGAAGLLCAAEIGDLVIRSDSSWLCRNDPTRVRRMIKLSKQLGFQERVDLRERDGDWHATDLDLGGDSWVEPFVLPFGGRPWDRVEQRGIPSLTTQQLPYQSVIGQAILSDDHLTEDGDGITSRYFEALNSADWQQPHIQWDKDGDWLRLQLPQVTEGHTVGVTIDLGRPSVGELLLEADSSASESKLDIVYSEAADETGRPILSDPRDHSRVDMATRVCFGEGVQAYHAFQIIGHRFATLLINGPASEINLSVGHRETLYPLEIRGEFETDRHDLMEIYRVSVSTQRNCMIDAYVDTPWREQAQWWGDTRIQARNTFYLSDDVRLFRRGLRQVGDPQQATAEGLTYGHAPTIGHYCVLPDYAPIWMLTIWDDYFQTGDPCLFEELWPRIDQVLGYFEQYGLADGELVPADSRYWLFLDWTPDLPRKGRPALLSMMLLEALDRVAELVDVVGLGGRAQRVGKLAEVLRHSIIEKLWDAENQHFRDGFAEDGSLYPSASLHTQVQALLVDVVPEEASALADRYLGSYLKGELSEGAQPTPFWLAYIYEAAHHWGLTDLALNHLREHWLPMVPFGGTWERFEPPGDGDTTCSHAWSAHPIHLLPQLLCGLRPTAPAWGEVVIKPHWESTLCSRASCSVPIGDGIITASWVLTNRLLEVNVELPQGHRAEVHLPTGVHAVGEGAHAWRLMHQDDWVHCKEVERYA
ncbi:alpha-L-rhamnosidase-related protein [Mucisphaera calidilacus]|uniref:Bacterial alpha-L-rhamnosidase n=1 Tax=Mucisphaera calidilacus TaxID=2527982 RepID=A0A518C095_9BACT|nr:alpha-L-rhamnosidase C-terminal domain-containing protein [Mucisphaera calidilacus]QDU72639.1 Bacterial alpha-L-rhamnosidase [Mucisphaera calidilacus]